MEQYFIHLPDKDLAYLTQGTENFNEYWNAMEWAGKYATQNREVMLQQIILALESSNLIPEFHITDEVINCHHNMVTKENHFGENVFVTRKGAVRARRGDRGIIPSNMSGKSFIVRGKGEPESFDSCSHGAGRLYSRTRAKEIFTLKDHELATQGVSCRKDGSVLDETPGAYKDIDLVMAAQSDLVEIEYTLKQVLCVKG